MKRQMLKSKLHRATVTQTNLDYEGSITLDPELCEFADILEFEKVEIYNCNNGARLSTYVIFGNKGDVCLNGAAARHAQQGDKIIIASFAEFEDFECQNLKPKIFILNNDNSVKKQ